MSEPNPGDIENFFYSLQPLELGEFQPDADPDFSQKSCSFAP